METFRQLFKDTKLESLDIGPIKQGWKAGSTAISEESLSNLGEAANLFRNTYNDTDWTRS